MTHKQLVKQKVVGSDIGKKYYETLEQFKKNEIIHDKLIKLQELMAGTNISEMEYLKCNDPENERDIIEGFYELLDNLIARYENDSKAIFSKLKRTRQ